MKLPTGKPKVPGRTFDQALATGRMGFNFGNLAVVVSFPLTLDPWLCVSVFRRVCLYRLDIVNVQTINAEEFTPMDKESVKASQADNHHGFC